MLLVFTTEPPIQTSRNRDNMSEPFGFCEVGRALCADATVCPCLGHATNQGAVSTADSDARVAYPSLLGSSDRQGALPDFSDGRWRVFTLHA